MIIALYHRCGFFLLSSLTDQVVDLVVFGVRRLCQWRGVQRWPVRGRGKSILVGIDGHRSLHKSLHKIQHPWLYCLSPRGVFVTGSSDSSTLGGVNTNYSTGVLKVYVFSFLPFLP
jgi:hypothetical protein